MSVEDLGFILIHSPGLSTLQVHITEGFLYKDERNDVIEAHLKLKGLSTCTYIASQILGPNVDAPLLVQLALEEQVKSKTPLKRDAWGPCVQRYNLDEAITHLTLAGIVSKSQAESYILPNISSWTGVKYLTLRDANQSPIVEAMTTGVTVLPNVVELVLEGTDISMDAIRNLVISKQAIDDTGKKGGGRIQKLVLNRCKGIDRAFCEEMEQRVDELAVYC
jgi:hypothetical protein